MNQKRPQFSGMTFGVLSGEDADGPDLADVVNGDFIRRNGGNVVGCRMDSAVVGAEGVKDYVHQLITGGIDVSVFVTGAGTERLLEQAFATVNRARIIDSLHDITTVAANKSVETVLNSLGIQPTISVQSGPSWRDVLSTIDQFFLGRGRADSNTADESGLANLRVSLEESKHVHSISAGLEARGCFVVRVPVFKLSGSPTMRDDTLEPFLALLEHGQLDAVLFCSPEVVVAFSHKANHIKRLKSAKWASQILHGKVVIAAGEDTAEILRDQELPVDVVLVNPKLAESNEGVAARIENSQRQKSDSKVQGSGLTMTLEDAFNRTWGELFSECTDHHWTGQLSASALSTATAISALSYYREAGVASSETAEEIQRQIDSGIRWIMARQNEDGGWGDTELSYSNISTTMLVVAALTSAGQSAEFADSIRRANTYIDNMGRIDGLVARYGKDKTFAVPILANCAMAGIVAWREVAALPFEAACVPQRFYNWMQLPVVSYAIPALVAIGQAKFANDPPWDPIRRAIRRLAIPKSLNVLDRMQPSTGGFLEAVPLTSFVSMGLIKSGKANHPVVERGIRFILESYRIEKDEKDIDGETGTGVVTRGSWPIDTDLATWLTTLSINALANWPDQFNDSRVDWGGCLEWLLGCQNTNVHPFTGAAPGGWGWTDLSGAVPDADDTPGALIAIHHLKTLVDFDDSVNERIELAACSGVEWLVNLQNRDKGWPTFCRGWGKLPFDRSGADITAHAIRALNIWKNDIESTKPDEAIALGMKFLEKSQRDDGSWLPLWFGNQDLPDDVNPCYGTAKVLAAYRDTNSFDTRGAEFGLRYLCDNQNPDGGWGGGASVRWADDRLGFSSVEETALCTEILLDHDGDNSRAAAQRGVEWLLVAVESGNVKVPTPIGFYFAKLWYYERLYPLVFATAALAKACEKNSVKTD